MSLKPAVVDFDQTWGKLRGTAQKVIQLDHVARDEWNERFHDVYRLCVAFPDPLSERVYQETCALLKEHVRSLYEEVASCAPNDMLSAYEKRWATYQQGVTYLSTLYIYLNTQYIRKFRYSNAEIEYGDVDQTTQLLEISELGAYLWKLHMILPLKDHLVRLLLEAINQDRCGVPQNKNIIHNCITSFLVVEEYKTKERTALYTELFEIPFLAATREHYCGEAKLLLDKNDCSRYMEQVLVRLDIERDRLKCYIPSQSHQRVIEAVEQCMVGEYLEFLQTECRSMVQQEAKKDLHNMFRLLKPVEQGLQALIKQIELHIREKGLEALRALNPKDENYVQCFVEDLLKVYQHNLQLITEVFDEDKAFISALDMACTEVVNYRENNKTPCRSPEVLARYFDSLLKKSSKCHSEMEIEEKLAAAINVFKYLNDKDVFQKFYSKMLAKRLIYSQYVSLDSEEAMINKLKQACGYEFTSKLHRMFTDIKVSDDLNLQFNTRLQSEKKTLPISFSIFVLQGCAWPLNQTPSVTSFNIPRSFECAVTEFEDFYAQRFSGRKLTWLHHLSCGEVKMHFAKRTYTVVMATFHISIILLFETNDSLTYEQIQQSTQLGDDHLQRHLQSFVEAKILLVNNPINSSHNINNSSQIVSASSPTGSNSSGNSFGDSNVIYSQSSSQIVPVASATTTNTNSTPSYSKDTMFVLNKDFSNKRLKFKLIVAQQKETPQTQQKDSEVTHANVEEDRKLFLQAAIVRILKSRKRMHFNQLLAEVVKQAQPRFMPSVATVRKTVESLIEKQYLDRCNNSSRGGSAGGGGNDGSGASSSSQSGTSASDNEEYEYIA